MRGGGSGESGSVQEFFFFSSRRRHTRFDCDWSSDVCSSDLMSLWRVRALLAVVAVAMAVGLSAALAGQTGATPSTGDTEWRFFGGDAGATRYSPANQISSDNVRMLRVAWGWSSRNFGPRPATTMQVSPLMVNGVM